MSFTLLDSLKNTVNIDLITNIYFKNIQQLDKEKTFELMEQMEESKIEGIEDISFWGKDFKIIVGSDMDYFNEPEYSFVFIDLKKPRVSKVIVPNSLTKTLYSEKFNTPVLESEEEAKVRMEKEAIEEAIRKEKYTKEQISTMKERIKNFKATIEEYAHLPKANLKTFDTFTGGKFNTCKYVIVPESFEFTNGYNFTPQNLKDEIFTLIDYVGYARTDIFGDLDSSFRYEKEWYSTKNVEDETLKSLYKEYNNLRNESIQKLLELRVLVPVVGYDSASCNSDYTVQDLANKLKEL